LKNVRKRRKEGMRRRHIRVMAKMRLSDLIRSEDARTGRKNVATVAGMVGASALGFLLLAVSVHATYGPGPCGSEWCRSDQQCCTSDDPFAGTTSYYCAFTCPTV